MLFSEEKKFLYIHIQKTAGTSIRHLLEENVPDLQSIGKTHDPYIFAEERFEGNTNEYLIAAFVRNPFDRLVSWYSEIQANYIKVPDEVIKKNTKPNKLRKYVKENTSSFDDFIKKCVNFKADSGWEHFRRNQLEYISNSNGEVAANYIGRFENIREDIETLLIKIGLDNVKLAHKNKSSHRDYKTYYTDELREIVENRYSRDLEYFGYEF